MSITRKKRIARNKNYTHLDLSKKYKILKTKGLTEIPITDKTSYAQSYTHKNPDQYNEENINNQGVTSKNTHNKRVYIESYGCQMNFSDSEIVASILSKEGYHPTQIMESADLSFGQYLLDSRKSRINRQKTIRAI